MSNKTLPLDAAKGPKKATFSMAGKSYTFVEPGFYRSSQLMARISAINDNHDGVYERDKSGAIGIAKGRSSETYIMIALMCDVVCEAIGVAGKAEEARIQKGTNKEEVGRAYQAIVEIVLPPFAGTPESTDPVKTAPDPSTSGGPGTD